VRRNDGHGTVVKENDGGKWSSDGVVLWLRRRQNREVETVMEIVAKLEINIL
jgi:hypothetical protein